MPNRRRQQGSFREPVEKLASRLVEGKDRPASKASSTAREDAKRRARCPAFHNQALFERSEG